MKETKYIPGDLVMFKNPFEPSDTCVGIVKFLGNISDIILLCPYTNLNLEYFIKVENIQDIPITPEILEKNGWNKEPSENVTWYKYRTDKSNLYICKDSFNNKDWLVCVALDKHYVANIINYVHQLQHILFGLELNSEMEV